MDVDQMNQHHLGELKGSSIQYVLRKQIVQPKTTLKSLNLEEPKFKWALEGLLRDLSLKDLFLKVDAQVVLTSNLDVAGGLCNGSRGVVIGFVEAATQPDSESAFARHPFRENSKMI